MESTAIVAGVFGLVCLVVVGSASISLGLLGLPRRREEAVIDANSPAPAYRVTSPGSTHPVDPIAPLSSVQVPFRPREAAVIALAVVLCDATLYSGHGFLGFAVAWVLLPCLLFIAAPRARLSPGVGVLWGMLALLAARLLWGGSVAQVLAGGVLVVAFSLVVAGETPFGLRVASHLLQAVPAGGLGLLAMGKQIRLPSRSLGPLSKASVALPVAAVAVFGAIFVAANPDLSGLVGRGLVRVVEALQLHAEHLFPSPGRFVFWTSTALLVVGLSRPSAEAPGAPAQGAIVEGKEPADTPLFQALRNTLMAVIALFAIYLLFEFKTLWFRTPPPGFYYAGYAHEGATWLTLALALASAGLSAVFHGPTLQDHRLPALRKLAWIWGAENLLLALSTYNRVHIYIGYNGLTVMRIVGIVGISTVVVGLLLVLRKISQNEDFIWLVRRQTWAFFVALYVLAILPADDIATAYNVARVLRGDPAPAVQITSHSTAPSARRLLIPLMHCQDAIIREGIRARLGQDLSKAEQRSREQQEKGWTAWQLGDILALGQLRAARPPEPSPEEQQEAIDKLTNYANRWY